MIESVLGFAREGFAEVNAVLGLLIAVVAALMMTSWARLPFIAIGAALAHIVLETLAPVIAESGGFELPDLLQPYFWRYAGVLFVGYLIVVAILFAIKRLVLKK